MLMATQLADPKLATYLQSQRIPKVKAPTFPPEVLGKLAQFPQTREGIKAKKAYLKSLKL